MTEECVIGRNMVKPFQFPQMVHNCWVGRHSAIVEPKPLLEQRMNLRVTTGEQYFLCCGKPPLIFLLVAVAAKAVYSCECL